MNSIKHLQYLLLALLFTPAVITAQNFNNTYGNNTPYENSVHTCGIHMQNNLIATGGSVDDPNTGLNVVQVATVDPGMGMMTGGPFLHIPANGMVHEAVDLVESVIDPTWAIVVSNMIDPNNNINRVGVFKTNTMTGAVSWSLMLGALFNTNLHGSAIRADVNGNVYVLGYRYNVSGNREMYMAKISDAGAVIWENTYTSNPLTDDFQSVDLMYNGGDLIVTANYFNPTPNGIVVARVSSATGFMGPVQHVTNIFGTANIRVRDIEFINGNYVLVGQVNVNPRRGFLIQYTSGMTLFAVSQVYDILPDHIVMTGVKPSGNTPPDMYVSFDRMIGGVLTPGIAQVDGNGNMLNAFDYAVPGYLGSRGLIGVNANNEMVVKGATNSTAFPGLPSLSLVGTTTPQAIMPMLCNSQINIDNDNGVADVNLPITIQAQTSYTCNQLILNDIHGEYYDCNGTQIGNFKVAPTGIGENNGDHPVKIYPNPSNGNITIDMSEANAGQYETAEVFNTLGELVMVVNINKAVEVIDFSAYGTGVYLVRMTTSDGQLSDSQRIVIK